MSVSLHKQKQTDEQTKV